MTKNIEIEFYSGSRGEELPRALLVEGSRFEVGRILRMEVMGSTNATCGNYRLFTVQTEDGALWNLREAPEDARSWIVTSVK